MCSDFVASQFLHLARDADFSCSVRDELPHPPGMRTPPLLSLVVITACSSPATSSPASEPAPTVEAAPAPAIPTGTAVRMLGHFEDSLLIRDAVIAGELADLRPPATRLATAIAVGALPAAWQSHVQASTALAAKALDATSIAEAAQAAAGLARTCGECHTAVGDGPAFLPGEPPITDPNEPKSQMLRHQWAADRMWRGLVARSDPSWQAGAAALTDAPLSIDAITADVELPDDLKLLGQQVHGLGQRALSTPEWPGRAQIYGEFITACATCHRGGC
jgi:cytochrome c553